MSHRIEKLRNQIALDNLDAIIISQDENRRYLSGFTGSAGYLVVSRDCAILLTDFRYIDQAQAESPDFEIVRIKGTLPQWLPQLLTENRLCQAGIEGRGVSISDYKNLTDAITAAKANISIITTEGIVESLRAIKDTQELGYIENAATLSDAALDEILPTVQPGITEKELAWKLESFMRRNGSEPLPFEIIVASGPRSALPHAKPTNKVILSGEPVVIDFGAKIEGYCSDITRTICLGEQDNTFRRIYDIVLGAQLTAMAILQAGMSGEQADQLARTVIAQAGYENNFGHGLGHGLGLAPHEAPRIGPVSADILTDGMVFTIEPGIYINGWGGIRIEDTVLLEKSGIRSLSTANKT